MKQAIDAVFEDGTFRPVKNDVIAIPNGQRVRIVVEDGSNPDVMDQVTGVYDGLSPDEIDAIENIALSRRDFFAAKERTE